MALRSATALQGTIQIANSLQKAIRCHSTASTTDTLRSALGHCVVNVKQYDYENYIWAIQLPQQLRADVITLRSFDIDLGLIGDHARTEMLVLMRTQWWKDAVNACFNSNKKPPPSQPTIIALENLVSRKPITRYRLQRIITTRESDLTTPAPPPTLAALEEYAEGTASQLLYLQLEAAGATSNDAEHAASHLGRAVGLTNLLRKAVPFAQRGRCYLPVDLCEKHGVGPEDVLHARPSEGIKDVTLEVAAAAKSHLEQAVEFSSQIPSAARPLFLPAVACRLYLKELEKCNFDMFDPRLQSNGGYSPLNYQLRLKWHMLRGTY